MIPRHVDPFDYDPHRRQYRQPAAEQRTGSRHDRRMSRVGLVLLVVAASIFAYGLAVVVAAEKCTSGGGTVVESGIWIACEGAD